MNKPQRQRVYERLLPYAKKHFTLIEVKAGEYNGYGRCHQIARHALETGKADTIAVTLSFLENSGVNVHYINSINGEYVDNTLGYLSKANTYYLIREGGKKEFDKVDMIQDIRNQKISLLSELFTAEEILKYDITIHHL